MLLVVVVVVDSLMETPILQDTKFLPFFPESKFLSSSLSNTHLHLKLPRKNQPKNKICHLDRSDR
jgi:hypothetical protein